MLTPCFKLKTNGVLLHYADLAVDCESVRFGSAKALAIVMIFVYPLGIPSFYAFLLFRARRQINPLGCDALQAVRVRNELVNANPELRALEFLFSCYRPGAYGFEVFESFRRIAMTGLIRYVAKTSGPPIAGILLSLVSVIVFREVQPVLVRTTLAGRVGAPWSSRVSSSSRGHACRPGRERPSLAQPMRWAPNCVYPFLCRACSLVRSSRMRTFLPMR